ncbi:MAG TPA: hypothetical protein VK982_13045 [Bacteroidales bacterium]|nr:hypothetical protein [Bacteroidales bacterium]
MTSKIIGDICREKESSVKQEITIRRATELQLRHYMEFATSNFYS